MQTLPRAREFYSSIEIEESEQEGYYIKSKVSQKFFPIGMSRIRAKRR